MPVELPVKDEPDIQNMVPTAGSTGASFVDTIPLRLVLVLAAPYIAGQTQEDAIKAAHRIYKQDSFAGTIDILGEDAESAEQCDAAVSLYTHLIDAISRAPVPVAQPLEQITVSMKPSMFSTEAPGAGAGGELDRAYARIKAVVDHAHKRNIRLTLEAEDHRWTDFHINSYISLINEGYTNLGTVLQSRLFRTRNDIRRFDERMRVRLVIGIYNEVADIAHTEKPVMKELLVEYAAELGKRGTYIELATHDAGCLDSFMSKVAIPQRLPGSQFETQFLMGVPRKKLQTALRNGSYLEPFARQAEGEDLKYLEELTQEGILVRLYLPFGKDKVAGPYCKRRLKANPNMIGYGIKNLLHIQ
jgi:proline dehydrogenase